MLVTVIMTLLGISFLLMGETENLIARNEKRAAQSLYVAEAGARAVKRWFDDPRNAIAFPDPTALDRTQRRIIDETDPYDPADATPANGVIGSFPYYKQQVDLDGDSVDDLFDRPYRGAMLHSLLGTEDGPDIRIDDGQPGPARDFLDQLSRQLLAGFPPEGGDVQARISRIDVYAPPYVQVGANWNRYGMGTVKIVARVYQGDGTDSYARVIAEREVEAVLSETPYYGPFGPLHSCSNLTFTRQGAPVGAHWGAVTAERGSKFTGAPTFDGLPLGLPRAYPAVPRLDLLWNSPEPTVENFLTDYDGQPGAPWDPWFRTLSGEGLEGAPEGTQPFAVDPPSECCDRSNLVQTFPLVSCPEYDYEVWKTITGSGERDVHYYVWDPASQEYRENGAGPSASFADITDEAEGIYFFDTRDGVAPYDNDGDGDFDNLTPAIVINDAGWYFRGVLFLNAESFRLEVDPAASRAVTFNAPGEPFQDADQDGAHDPGEAVVHLNYATTLNGAVSIRDPGGAAARLSRGPDIAANASFHGILFTNGTFEATGGGNLYGSVIAKQGVVQRIDDGSMPTPDIYWDETILASWPPPGWKLPRVTVTRWITDR
jgi:hypothetical protein